MPDDEKSVFNEGDSVHGPYREPLDRWHHLPEWKRQWFEDLSARDIDLLFPRDRKELDEWMEDRAYLRSLRNKSGKVVQYGLTAAVSIIVMAIASSIWLGIQSSLGLGRH